MNTKKILASLIALAAIPGAQAAMFMGSRDPLGSLVLLLVFRPFSIILATIGGLIYLFKVLEFRRNKWQKRIGIIIGTIMSELIAMTALSLFISFIGSARLLFIRPLLNIPFVILLLAFPILIRVLIQITGGTEHKWRIAFISTVLIVAIAAALILAGPIFWFLGIL